VTGLEERTPGQRGAPARGRFRPAAARQAVLLVVAGAVVIQGASIIIVPRGDLGNHVEWARRLLGGRFLYDGGLNLPYTPAWALAHVPLVPLSPSAAAAVTFLAGLIATAVLLAVLHRFLRPARVTREERFWIDAAALVLASRFLLRDLADGGPNVALLALVFTGLLFWARGRDATGGALVGIATALKWTPALFLAWLAWKRQWRALAAGLLAALAVTLAPALFTGPVSFARHMTTWVANVAPGFTSADPASGVLGVEPVRNLALRPVLGRLLAAPPTGHDPSRDGPWPGLLDLAPATAAVASALAATVLLSGTAWAFRRPVSSRLSPEVPVELAAVALLAVLLSPIAWRSHAVAVLPALVVLGHRVALRRKLSAPAALLLGAWLIVLLVLNRAVAGARTVEALHGLGFFTALLLGLLALLLVEHRRPASGRERAPARAADPVGPAFVVVPTYDEAENLPGLARRLLALPEGLRLLVVDDASPDGTGAIADALARENPGRVAVLHRPGKLGLGTAYLAGIEAALASGASHVVTMDADFSHEPERLPALLEASGRADVVIGSRYAPGGGAVDSPLSRRLLSRAANLTAHATLGLETRDATAGFRVYRRRAAETLLAAGVVSSGYSFLLEATFLFEERGFAVEEVPIRFRDRREGRSKISRGEIGKAAATVARLAARRFRRLLGATVEVPA
jgi:hypothetical protein